MDIYPFKTLYIADLNAIQSLENNGHSHINILEEINAAFPDVKLWVDAGINTEEKARKWCQPYTQLILGSECFSTIEQYQSLASKLKEPFTLSLDYSLQGSLGPNKLIKNSRYWPKDIIAMTLEKVGTNAGPDIKTIKNIMSTTSSSHAVYAAGGIRDTKDLIDLKHLGVNGALLASALHNKQISTQDCENIIK